MIAWLALGVALFCLIVLVGVGLAAVAMARHPMVKQTRDVFSLMSPAPPPEP